VNAADIISSGLLESYAAGMASDAEKQQVAAWVKQYPEVAAELESIEQALETYTLTNAVAPAAGVRDKVLATINGQQTASPVKVVSLNKNYWKWAAAAAVVLLIGSTALNINYYSKYTAADAKLKESQEQLVAAAQQVNNLKEDLSPVTNKYSKPVSLTGTPALPDATAKIFWLTNTGEVMIDASNLPDAPSGKQYQFWAIVDGQPVDGGLIITNDKGKKFHMQKMKTFGRAEAFAISLEKEGGSLKPTEVVSVGKII